MKKSIGSNYVVIIAGIAIIGLSNLPVLDAATLTWTNTAGGSWETAGNWNPNSVPVNSSDISISANGPYTVNIDNTTANTGSTSTWMQVNSLNIDNSVGLPTLLVNFTNTLREFDISGGTDTIIGNNGLGAMTISNGTVKFQGGSILYVGLNSGAAGTLNIAGGTVTSSEFLVLGRNGGSSGVLNMSGGQATFSAGAHIGSLNNSTGTVNITGGQLTINGNTFLGVSAGNTLGLINSSGGLLTLQNVYMGQGGTASNTWTITGGTNLVTGGLTMGQATGSKAYVNLSGGVLAATNSDSVFTTIASQPNSTAAVTVNGGTYYADRIDLAASSGASGKLLVNNGSVNIVGSFFRIGVAGGGATGLVSMTGGTLTSAGTSVSVGSGDSGPGAYGQLDISGGTVGVRGMFVGAGNSSTGTVNVSGGKLLTTNSVYNNNWIGFGVNSLGTMNTSGGETWMGDVYMALQSGSRGIWNITGGTNYVTGTLNVTAGSAGAANVDVSGAGLLDLQNASLGNGSAGGFVTNRDGGTVRFRVNSPTITLNNAASKFAVKDATIEFNGVSAANLAGDVINNITYSGVNTLRFNNATNTSVAAMTFAGDQKFATLDLLNNSLWQSTALTVGDASNTGTVNINNSQAMIGAGQFRVGDGGSATGTINVAGGQLSHNGNDFIGISSGVGILNTTAGTVDLADVALAQGGSSRGTWNISGGTNRVSGALKLGVFGGDQGFVNLNGGALYVTNASANAQVLLGWLGGQGTWVQSNGTTVVNQMLVGNGNGSGSMTLVGGTFTANNTMEVTAGGQITVSGGTLNVTEGGGQFFRIGSSAGSAQMDITSGLVNASGGQMRIGEGVNATGTVNVAGGQFAYTSGAAFLGISGGVGTLNSSGGRTDMAAGLTVGQDSASKGTWNISGGTNWANGLNVAYGQLWLTGGELNVTNSSANAVASISPAASNSLLVQSNGLFRADKISIASNTGTGTVSLVNGQITAGILNVGESSSGGKGFLGVSGGTINAGFLGVGIGSYGQFDLSNGVVNSSGQLQIAQSANQTGVVNQVGGQLSISSVTFIGVGGGMATLNSSGGNATFTGGVNMGNGSATIGRWNITGGTNLASSVNVATAGGDHRVEISGAGLLQAPAFTLGSAGAAGFVTNRDGGTVRFAVDSPTIALNNAGSKFVVKDAKVEFKDVANANLTGDVATKITYVGNNTLKLNNATNANVATYTFQTNTPFAKLDLIGGRFQSTSLMIGNGGSVIGTGTIASGSVTNAGTIAPGHSPGVLTLTGNLTLLNTSVLAMQLGGTSILTDYDRIIDSGLLTLDGALSVSLINAFNPTAGNSFDLLDWGSVAGTFNTLNLPSLDPGLTWDTSSLYTTGTLLVTAVVPEPSTIALLVLGGLMLRRRFRVSRN